MAAFITEVGIEVTGSVVRKSDGTKTTLIVTEDQAREIHESLGTVLAFFDSQRQ